MWLMIVTLNFFGLGIHFNYLINKMKTISTLIDSFEIKID